jgi:Double zinc ribbon
MLLLLEVPKSNRSLFPMNPAQQTAIATATVFLRALDVIGCQRSFRGSRAVQCPSCNAKVPGGSRFCGQCGIALPTVCPSCGHAYPAQNKFCSNCGTSLSLGASQTPIPIVRSTASSAERRQLTVMSCEVLGSSAHGSPSHSDCDSVCAGISMDDNSCRQMAPGMPR